MCQYTANPTETYRRTLRLLTFSNVHCHLQSAVDIPTFEFRQQRALSDTQWPTGTQALLLTRHTKPGDSHGRRCDAVSSDEWFLTFRRIVLPSPSTACNTRTRRHSPTFPKTQSASLCANVFRKVKQTPGFHLAPTTRMRGF